MKAGDKLTYQGYKATYLCDIDGSSCVIELWDTWGFGDECGSTAFIIVVPTESCLPESECIFDEYKAKLEAAQRALHDVEGRLSRLHRELEAKGSKLTEGIIDLSELRNAKETIHIFDSDLLRPICCKKPGYYSRISIDIKFDKEGHRAWCTEFRDDDYDGMSRKVDDTYGFFIDKSDEEMAPIALERAATRTAEAWGKHTIVRTDNRYLTPEMVHLKSVYQKEDAEKSKKQLKDEIAAKEKRLAAIDTD